MPEQSNESGARSETGSEYVRLVHLAPDVGEVRLEANGARGFDSAELLEDKDYTTYQANSVYRIVVYEVGDDSPLLETDIELSTGPVTLALIGEQCQQSDRPLRLVALQDEFSAPDEGHARLRIVHASPDAPQLDVRNEAGDEMVSGLSFGEAEYAPTSAGESIISVHRAGEDAHLFRFELEPEENATYTAYAIGYLNPKSAPSAVPDDFSFALGVTEDTDPSAN